jgi:hypothetical protein
LTAAYEARSQRDDLSTVVRIPVEGPGTTLRFMPVFHYQNLSRFVGFSVPARFSSCVASVGVVDDVQRISTPVEFTRTPNGGSSVRFQQLVNWERAQTDRSLVYSRPRDLVAVSSDRVDGASISPDRMSTGFGPRQEGPGWTGSAVIDTPETQLVHFPARPVTAGAVLQATGVLRRGGLRVGVLRDDLWFDSQLVDTRGPFIVLIRMKDAGTFGALVSDGSSRQWRVEPSSLLRTAVHFAAPWLLVDDFELHDVKWIPADA